VHFVEDWPLQSLNETMLVFSVSTTQATTKIAEKMRQQRAIKTVQAVRRMTVAASSAPRSGKPEPLRALQDNLSMLGLANAHRWSTGLGVRIAIIDTGVDRRHPELRNRIEQSVDFTAARSRDFDRDVHGTIVASIIAGARDNKGMLGVAPDANLIVLKACTERTTTVTRSGCDSVALARALDYAINQAPGVINLSLAGVHDPLLARLVAEAVHRNIAVVAAANYSIEERFPTAVPGVLAVAAASNGKSKIEQPNLLLAPGRFVLGALPGGDYDFFSGSSVATAEVSGIVALLLQRKPHLAPDVIARLLETASHSETGIVQACDSLSRIVGAPCNSE
jgi:subtilisin family serine protease